MQSSLSTETLKKWAELTPQLEEEKLRAIGALLKKYDLTRVQPVSADHQVQFLKSGFTNKQSRLMVTGKVPASRAHQVRQFSQEVKS